MNRLFVSVLSLICLSAFAGELTLPELQKKLTRNGTWKASNNKVSQLSLDEKKAMMGAILPEGFDDYFMSRDPEPATNSRAALDWRDKGGFNYVAPIMDQGRCGSCVAFASIQMLRTQMNINHKTSGAAWTFSPQHLFSCGGAQCDQGWTLYGAGNFLKETGVPDESCFPYESGQIGKDLACSQSCSDASERSVKVLSTSMPTFLFPSVESIKSALADGPVMAAFNVYEDFMFYESGVYKTTGGKVLGGHAVTIVGYNDADRSWIVANSWGPDWGENGFFRISYDDNESGMGRMSLAIKAPTNTGYVTLSGIEDRDVVSGTVGIQIESTFKEPTSLEWNLQRRVASNRSITVAAGASFSSQLNTMEHEDGIYELKAIAHHRTATETQPKTVYILNGKLDGSLGFINVTEGQELSEKIVLEFDVDSTPIPFNRVTFIAKNTESGELYERSTTNVGAKMAMSFQSEKVPNGKYELKLVGTAGNQTVESAPVMATINN